MIRLDSGDDAAVDEDDYQFEVLLPIRRFVKIAQLPACSGSFVDTMLQQQREYPCSNQALSSC